MFENILNRVKLLALAAIVQAEIWAADQLETVGAVIKGPEKRVQAVAAVVSEYKRLTAGIALLNMTTADDELIETAAEKAVDWAFDRAGEAINAARAALPTPSTTAPELPVGGLE